MKNEFKEFVAACEDLGVGVSVDNMSADNKYQVGNVWANVKELLSQYNLISPDKESSLENLSEPTSVLNNTVGIVDIGPKALEDLVESCNVSQEYIASAVNAVGLCLTKYKSSNAIAEHYSARDVSIESIGDMSFKKLDSIYSAGQLSNLYPDSSTSLESFGARIDSTLLDAKVGISITILKFHKSILPRLIPNKPTTSNIIMYEVDRFEVYDLTKAGADTAQERYKSDHRVPFIDLYKNPTSANMAPKPVIVKDANDTSDDFVMSDGYLYVAKNANLFDLSMDSTVIGYDHVDFTDLIGEGAKLDEIVLAITYDIGAGNVTEYLPVTVSDRQGTRFVMSPNANDAADRFCALDFVSNLDNEAEMLSGVVSDIMDDFDDNHIIEIEFNVQGKLNLRTSFIHVLGSLKATFKTKDGTAIVSAQQDIFDDISSIAVVAYKPASTFSEENIRKTTKAMRVLTKPIGYEIPGSTNVVVQHSLIQPRPENTINALSKLMRIGNDDRGVNIILDCITNVYNRIQSEASSPDLPYEQKIMNDFVAGHKSTPYIYQGNIDVDSSVANMRSAEALGDIRGVVEKRLLEIITVMFNNSLYVQALDPGDRPVFKVLTSGYILDTILNVPYYHTGMDQSAAEKLGDNIVEYRRMLPNGVELNVITTNFTYFTDKIMMVPFLPGKPNSELNFASLIDKGSLVVNITPVVNNAGFKELIANAREFPLVLNPLAALLTVTGVSAVFEGQGMLGDNIGA